MKKKIILISLFMLCFILTGCSLNNTPKAKVETLLMKYQKNSDSVMNELDDYLNTLNIKDDAHEEYKKVYSIKQNYITSAIAFNPLERALRVNKSFYFAD